MIENQLRYPGAQPFEQQQRRVFFGREKNSAELYRMIKLEKIVVLYGKSGLGKSSLLNASIIPKVIDDQKYLPLRIRFNSWSERGGNMRPVERILIGLNKLHGGRETGLDKIFKNESSIWHEIKKLQIHQSKNKGLILFFDQFEELFSYPKNEIKNFSLQLAEAINSFVPQRYWDVLENMEQDGKEVTIPSEIYSYFQRSIVVKVVIAIRSDRLSLLDKVSAFLPTILKNCYELEPLDLEQAKEAIVFPALAQTDFLSPAFTYNQEALTRIINFLTKGGKENIESTQLQIVCNAMERKVIKQNLQYISINETSDLAYLIEKYYEEKIALLPNTEQQGIAKKLIEEEFIFEPEERRLSLFEGQVLNEGLSKKSLEILINSHLIRAELSPKGGFVFELSHDSLVEPILIAKKKRKHKEEKEEHERKEKLRIAELQAAKEEAEKEKKLREAAENSRKNLRRMAFFLVLALIVVIYGFWRINNQNAEKQRLIKYLNFSEAGMAWAPQNNRWVLIDKIGIQVSEKEYISVNDFKNGVAEVQDTNKLWNLINEEGKEISSAYLSIEQLNNTFYKVILSEKHEEYDSTYFYKEDDIFYNQRQYLVIRKQEFNTKKSANDKINISSYSKLIKTGTGNLWWGKKVDNKFYLLDSLGNNINDVWVEEFQPFFASKAFVKQNGEWGQINTDGKWKIIPSYSGLKSLANNIVAVKDQDVWMIFDKVGGTNLLPDLQFQNIGVLENSLLEKANFYGLGVDGKLYCFDEKMDAPKGVKQRFMWCIDNGHSGRVRGKYSPRFDDGITRLYEFKLNRDIVKRIVKKLDEFGIKYFEVTPRYDTLPESESLRMRPIRVSQFQSNLPKVFVSVHSNGAPAPSSETWGSESVNGIETWYKHNSRTGKYLAEIFQKELIEYTNWTNRNIKSRSRGEFFIFRNSNHPTILTENGFYNNKSQAKEFALEEIRQRIANAHVAAILAIEYDKDFVLKKR